jgi:hypothetical protein
MQEEKNGLLDQSQGSVDMIFLLVCNLVSVQVSGKAHPRVQLVPYRSRYAYLAQQTHQPICVHLPIFFSRPFIDPQVVLCMKIHQP